LAALEDSENGAKKKEQSENTSIYAIVIDLTLVTHYNG
jgi:hypothetical protein